MHMKTYYKAISYRMTGFSQVGNQPMDDMDDVAIWRLGVY